MQEKSSDSLAPGVFCATSVICLYFFVSTSAKDVWAQSPITSLQVVKKINNTVNCIPCSVPTIICLQAWASEIRH